MREPRAESLTIGEFSRITHLGIKALRHYHDVGLLAPDAVDPATGYRHYSLAQIPAAQVIRRLRELDLPVDRVREVLAAPDPTARGRVLAEHLARLEQRLAETRAAVDSLKDLLEPPADGPAIELRAVPATAAIAISATVDRDELLAWWRGALGELEAVVDAQRLPRSGPAGGLFASELFQHDRGEVTMFVPVAAPSADRAPRAVGRAAPATIPAAELAILEHRGSYAGIDASYGALGAHVTRHALGVDGPVREYYVVDARTTHDPRAWRTELGWPVFGT